jgi:predicted DNA binding protein
MLTIFTHQTLPYHNVAVIAHIRVHAHNFKLGRILDVTGGSSVSLESLVPLGERAVPFFSVHGKVVSTFESDVRDHPGVNSISEINSHGDRVLYALDWDISEDTFFRGLAECEVTVLSGTGGPETWSFELRFPSHKRLAQFREYCDEADIGIKVGRIYNPTRPEGGPFYGLTQPQRQTLVRAVQGGYYSIPRRMSTQDLAEEFDISDQAVTERLRRAIITLVDNSVVPAIEQENEFDE